ncbi:hypothetical protein F5X99DRAFT_409717 [Biscogniauxia marginata]|nr:hypothetical protein F5X99DRAFT_409717 [Biscogniauxia marginata]
MSTGFLVLSDTHDDAFSNDISKVGVVLHCGDLTMIGGMNNSRQALENIKHIDAELKLAIAGRDGESCGCPKLFNAIERSCPRLHCFGRIHKGYGVQSITWTDTDKNFVLSDKLTEEDIVAAEGKTVLVNATVKTYGAEPDNKPWVVINLEKGRQL